MKYSKTQIEKIDSHHAKILAINEWLNEVIKSESCNKDLAKVFYKLTFTAEDYFTDTEIILKKNQYPYFKEYKQKHLEFSNALQQIKRSYISGNDKTCQVLKNFLSDWCNENIYKKDENLINFLKNKIDTL